MKLNIILCLILGVVGLAAEIPSLEQLLKSAETVEDPSKRKKVEKKIKAMHEESKNFVPPDYASKTTQQLIGIVLRNIPMDPEHFDLIENVLRERKDFKGLLRNEISSFDANLFNPPNPIAVRSSDPFVCAGLLARVGGKDFQIEITKKCIDHPIVVKMGESGLSHMLTILARVSINNEEAVLDKLIKQGRIEKGTAFENSWRKKLRKTKKRPVRESEVTPRVNSKPKINKKAEDPVAEIDDLLSKWLIGLSFLLALCGLTLWVKKRKRP